MSSLPQYPPTAKPLDGYAANQYANAGQQEQQAKMPPADPWQHRSDGMRCKTCMWFLAKHPSGRIVTEAYSIGRCRRHAPTMNGFPVVFVNDWCGDHRIDENKL